jgi:hypothetical protein
MNAADVLSTILFARSQGAEPAMILDENSPLMDAAREVLKPGAPPEGGHIPSELERNWLIQAGLLTPIQADKSTALSEAITPSEVMRAYRIGCGALAKANEQVEHFERLWYLRGDALEFAEYLAKQADNLLTALEYEDMARVAWDESGAGTPEFERWGNATESRCAHATALRSRIYEFRKRATDGGKS